MGPSPGGGARARNRGAVGVFRTIVRRNYFLDPLSVLDDDIPMQERIERLFADLRATARPRPGPQREELIEVMRSALAA
jgi:hypothetical protein